MLILHSKIPENSQYSQSPSKGLLSSLEKKISEYTFIGPSGSVQSPAGLVCSSGSSSGAMNLSP